MKNLLKNGNWGLKLLALILAIILYHVFKTEPIRIGHENHDFIRQSE